MKNIAQLIGHTLSITYLDIYIVMGMTIDPEIDVAILDIIFQFHNEGSVGLTVGKLRALHLEGWNMMGDDYLSSGFAA